MILGVLRVELYLHGCGSLKSKRKEIRSIKDRLRRSFNVSVSEVDNQDLWNRGSIGVVVAGSDAAYVQETLDRVREFLEKNWPHLIMDLSGDIIRL